MTARRRVAAAAARLAGAGRCPGRGLVTELVAVRHPDPVPEPPACPVCGGCHTQVVVEVIVARGPDGRPAPVDGDVADNGRVSGRITGGGVP